MTPIVLGFHLTATSIRTQSSAKSPRFAAKGTSALLTERLPEQTWKTWVLGMGEQAPTGAIVTDARNSTMALLCGEIYNRAELETALDEQSAGSDAALLLRCFQRYGAHAFRLLNGRFAAVIASGTRVIAATDHAGSVPLYLYRQDRTVTVTTEVKTVASLNVIEHTASISALSPVRGKSAAQIAAGTVIVHDIDHHQKPRAMRTWSPPLHRRAPHEDEAVALVREALTRSVGQRLRDIESPPTAVLSGGIDSSSVTVLAAAACGAVHTVSMGTDDHNEFDAAREVADHVRRQHPGCDHAELTVTSEDVLSELPWAVWAAEVYDATIIEYLLPLTVLYRRLAGPARRVLTGYGADIPLGGMHRDIHALDSVENAIVYDMSTFDGLNELTPVLAALGGHWTTHPFWDREVLDALIQLEAGLKRRHQRDKWVLRRAMTDLLPSTTIARPKLGVHEGSGISAAFSEMVRTYDVPADEVAHAKQCVVRSIYDQTVGAGRHPEEVDLSRILADRPWREASRSAAI